MTQPTHTEPPESGRPQREAPAERRGRHAGPAAPAHPGYPASPDNAGSPGNPLAGPAGPAGAGAPAGAVPPPPQHAPRSGLEARLAGEHALELIDHDLREGFDAVRREVGRIVVGQTAALDGLLIALLCSGHVLLEGVPGVAKTLLVRTLSAALDLAHSRIQFTPDLMPADVTGSLVFDAAAGGFEFRAGPVFTHLLIADEINRTPPKTQSALLEAMEERRVSVDGEARALPDPFLVAATQNPLEYEGTYPLPEAQLDRFLFKLVMDPPDRAGELEILRRHAAGFDARELEAAGLTRLLDAQAVRAARARAGRIHAAPEVLGYLVDLVQATRAAPSLALGVSPRGATRLLGAARARAWLAGRAFITPDDVKALAPATFRHRVILRPEAQMDGIGADQVIAAVIDSTPVPR